MSTTYKNNDIFITNRDTLSSVIKEVQEDGTYLPKVFDEEAEITLLIWETSDMNTLKFSKTLTPDVDNNITLYLTPTENDFDYGTYYYSLLETRTDDDDFRNTLIPESGETCDTPRYVVCKGDGDVSV